jgi:hypothetical protein
MPIEELVASRRRSRAHLKRRLLSAGIKQNRCEQCGITEWQGRPLSMALHHLNGDGRDNRLENLQLLCPNCHSQTDTFAGRNRPLAKEFARALPLPDERDTLRRGEAPPMYSEEPAGAPPSMAGGTERDRSAGL